MFFVGWWPVALRWLPQGAQEPILLARTLRDPRKSNEAARDLFLMQHPKFEKKIMKPGWQKFTNCLRQQQK